MTFIFGMDASPTLVALAEGLSEAQWRGLERAEPEIKTEPRERPENVKEQIVRERELFESTAGERASGRVRISAGQMPEELPDGGLCART